MTVDELFEGEVEVDDFRPGNAGLKNDQRGDLREE